jgi:DNA ligase-4
VAFDIIDARSTIDQSLLTVVDVNDKLDQLAKTTGEARIKLLEFLFSRQSPFEIKWLLRIILKKSLGRLGTKTVLEVFHEHANEALAKRNNLRLVCDMLETPGFSITNLTIELFKPYKPMLAQRIARQGNKIEAIIKEREGAVFWMEEKFDGERVQIHKCKDRYGYWSRNARESTESYGESPKQGSLTPVLHPLIHSSANDVILDGEMVEYDPVTDAFVAFGTLKVAAKDNTRRRDNYQTRTMYCVFDILQLNGVPLLDQPLYHRRKILHTILKEQRGVLEIVKFQEATTEEEVRQALVSAVERREEGIVVKNPSSKYACGERNRDWIKLKPDYENDHCKDLDVLVVGGVRGKGIAAGYLESFLCGVLEKKPDGDEREVHVYSVCRVKNGLTYPELRNLFNLKQEYWHAFDPDNVPSWLHVSLSGRNRPDVWIHPYNSFVLTLQASELQRSSNDFAVNITMRFPRVVSYKEDKPWQDALTLDALRLHYRNYGQSLVTKAPMNKYSQNLFRRKRERPTKSLSMVASQRIVNTNSLSQHSRLFDGQHFYVVKGSPDVTKEEIETAIVEHGGTFSQTYDTKPNTILIAGSSSLKVKGIAKSDKFDMLRPSWILESITQGYRVTPVAKHYFYRRGGEYPQEEENAPKFTYKRPRLEPETTLQETQEPEVVVKVEEVDDEETTAGEDDDVPPRIPARTSLPPASLLSNIVAYFDAYSVLNDPTTAKPFTNLMVPMMVFQGMNATRVDRLEEGVTHVIVDAQDLARHDALKHAASTMRHPAHIVRYEWILDSLNHNRLLSEHDYTLTR